MDLLNKQQQEAVEYTQGPLLILAGAGSGKTRVLTHRIAYLIGECGVDPYHILAITFTNKAAEEMRERVDAQVGATAERVWVSTFHSACVRILRRYIDRIGYANNFSIYDTDDQKNIMKEICKRLSINTKVYRERTFLNAISAAKDALISPEELRQQAGSDYALTMKAKVYAEYQKVLFQNNALDFDDLIFRCVELLQRDEEVRAYYQNRFEYVMVDEYQDTNTAQFHLVRLLSGKYKNLCVVGDDDQSIYKFRGANIRNILNFEEYYPDAHVIKLEQNYRSTQTILDAANAVIAHNTGRKDKALWTDRGNGSRIVWRQLDTAYEEAEYVVSAIERAADRGDFSYGDSAILYRTNAQSRLLEEKLIFAGIPYRIIGGINFYSRREIKDMLAYLKTIDNGQDDLAVKRVINMPKRGIGAATITKVENYALERGISFYQALEQAERIPSIGKAKEKLDGFVSFIRLQKSLLKERGVSEMIRSVAKESGYLEMLEAEHSDEADARIENIEELISKAVAFEEFSDAPELGDFLDQVSLVADIDSLEDETDFVVLMTMHSAKGLEFPNVYITGMEDGLFPGYSSIVSDDLTDLEEERRLCYVGITRAKDALTLTAARERIKNGQLQYNRVSRFAREIPQNLLQGQIPPEPNKKETDFPFEDTPAKERSRTSPAGGHCGSAKQSFYQKPSYQAKRPSKDFGGGENLQKPDYDVGDRVRHFKFGEGTVTDMKAAGRDYEITVDFDRVGVKKMFALFAKLVRV